MESKTLPKIRFTGYSGDWIERKAANIFYSVSDKNYSNLPVLSATQEKGMVYRDDVGIDIQYNKKSTKNYKRVLPGQFVIHLRSFQGGFAFSDIEGITSPAYTVLDFKNKEKDYSLFWKYVLASDTFIKRLEKVTYGIRDGRSISFKDFSTLKLLAPSYNEQVKIGNFLKQVDDAIMYRQQELDTLQQTKQGFLQKMFPKEGESVPEIRFSGFTGDWQWCNLKDISEKTTEKNKCNNYTETFTNSAELGIITQRDFFDKDISNKKNLNSYYIVYPDYFVYNPRISNLAPVGPIKRNKLGRTGVMSPLYYVFYTHDVDKAYLEYYFSGNSWHKFMKLNGDSGARSDRFAIRDSIFREMPIPMPPGAEQIKIGSFFKQLDDAIALHEQELDTLKQTKKAFLQKMFV